MKYEFNTVEECNSFIKEAYEKGLRYIYHEPGYDRSLEGYKYVVEVLDE